MNGQETSQSSKAASRAFVVYGGTKSVEPIPSKRGRRRTYDVEPLFSSWDSPAILNEAFEIAVEHREQFLAAWKHIHPAP